MLGLPAWIWGALANLAISGSYLAIAWAITRGLRDSGQMRANRLATATALIFFTCAIHHGGDAIHVIAPLFAHDPVGLLARRAYTWQMDLWDLFGAGVAILYLSLRSSYGVLLTDPSMFHDLDRERLQAAIAADGAALAEAQALARIGSWRIKLPHGVLETSAEYRRLFELAAGDVAGGTELRIHPDDRTSLLDARRRLFRDGVPLDLSFRIEVPEAGERVLHARARAECGADGRPVSAAGTVQDVTDLVRARTARDLAEARFAAAFERAGVPMALIGTEGESLGRLLEVNAAYAEMLGVPAALLRGAALERWIHPEDREGTLLEPLHRIGDRQIARVESERRYLGRDDRVIPALVTESAITDADGRLVVIEQAIDISERKRFEVELRHMADHDALTGLFNRRRFDEELRRALAQARRFGRGGAVLMLDLDGFKQVNDTHGHAAGDRLVARLAAVFAHGLGESDVIARTGGDEFAVILPGAGPAAARRVAETLLDAVRREGWIEDDGETVRVSTSIGITLFAAGDELGERDLLVEADTAMYVAKAGGKDRIAVHAPETHTGPRARRGARRDRGRRLLEAVQEERFELWTQPIQPIGASGPPLRELTLRVIDADGDRLAPEATSEDPGSAWLSERMDGWLLEQAVSTLADPSLTGEDGRVAIPVAVSTLAADGFAARLAERLAVDSVRPERLILEVAEATAIAHLDVVRTGVRSVRCVGVGLALDDFGAGLATFYYLKDLGFDFVKIDGDFVRRLPDSPTDQFLVRSLVSMSQGLEAITIAKSVDDRATVELLRRIGVGYAQGACTGRPTPVRAPVITPVG